MLSSDPTGQEIWNEFGANSKPSTPAGTAYSIKDAFEKVFGLGAGAHNRLDFADTGQPSASTETAINVTDTEATLRASIVPNGVETSYYFEYGIGNYNSTTATNSVSTDTLVTVDVDSLDDNSNYQFRVVYWNAYNDNDEKVGSQGNFTTDSSQTKPYDLSLVRGFNFSEAAASWTNATASEPIQVEWEINSGSSVFNNYSAGTTSANRTFTSGDSIRFRARYTSGPDTGFSVWSNSINVT